jgi:hypothetical protein
MFNMTTALWQWIAGNNVTDSNSMIAGVARLPGSRLSSSFFTLAAYPTKLFVIGGFSFTGSRTTMDISSDVYEFDVNTRNWQYLKGANISVTANYTPGYQQPAGVYYSNGFELDEWNALLGPSFTLGDNNNQVWIYNRPTNRYIFLAGNQTAVDAAAANGGFAMGGRYGSPTHALYTNTTLRVITGGGYGSTASTTGYPADW